MLLPSDVMLGHFFAPGQRSEMFASTDTPAGFLVFLSQANLLFLCQQNGVSIMVQVALGPDAAGERVRVAVMFSSEQRRSACWSV